ncbi:hypothetical protein [Faecalibacterium hattorii]|uniref:hypothetical protein n=1 Tax=Faecalibacterium hattorii TaxID=2935520 RepID=UPI003AACA83D
MNRTRRAAEELAHMQTTTDGHLRLAGEPTRKACPKARRFAEYYIPTTLKLLHTYNDVQGQQGGQRREHSCRVYRGHPSHAESGVISTLYDNAAVGCGGRTSLLRDRGPAGNAGQRRPDRGWDFALT